MPRDWIILVIMTRFESIKNFWKTCTASQTGPWIDRLRAGELDVCHYQGFLLETYHNTRYNPQLQAYTTMFIPNNPHATVKRFYQHSISEIGHDQLALDDLMALGVDRAFVESSKPQPITTAFFANAIWGIQTKGPAYFLGYLFHLEFNPTENGKKYIEMLTSKGIPENALTFLEEHSTVDVAHNKFMEEYVRELVKTDADEAIVCEAIAASVDLHNRVLASAFENGERVFGQRLKKSASF